MTQSYTQQARVRRRHLLLASRRVECGDAPSPACRVQFSSNDVSGAAWQCSGFAPISSTTDSGTTEARLPLSLLTCADVGENPATAHFTSRSPREQTTPSTRQTHTHAHEHRSRTRCDGGRRDYPIIQQACSCDLPIHPQHHSDTTLFPYCAPRLSRVVGASCRGA